MAPMPTGQTCLPRRALLAGDEAHLSVASGGAGAAPRRLRGISRRWAANPGALPDPDLNPDKIVYLAFTSGTTGMPKGVLHSDNTLLANGRAMVKDWHHDDKTILFSHSPLSHHIGTVAIEQSLVAGFEVVVNDLPPGRKPLDWIVETGATYVMGVPTHAMDILADMKRRGMDKLGKVSIFYMAGSTIPPQTAKAFLDMGIKPQNIYGMTENGSHQYTLPDDDVEAITATCGRACHGYETRLWDQENPDLEAKPGEIGEIGTRGALLMLGYFNNQSATENSFNASGWFMSGDLGRFDARGNLQIVGRKKDLIIRGGHNIYPAHIENLTVKHPAVLKAAAFPVADERLGERVCLAIITRDGTAVDADQMLDHLNEHGLSKYDMPEYFICLDAFPQTASGKILEARTGRIGESGQDQARAGALGESGKTKSIKLCRQKESAEAVTGDKGLNFPLLLRSCVHLRIQF